MQTHKIVFSVVMFLTATSIIVALLVLLKWKLKNFEFEDEETLPLLAKRFSIIPLTVNLIIFGLIFVVVLLGFLPTLSVLCLFCSFI